MPSATRTITINRPVSDVFAFVADGGNGMQWRSGVLDIAAVPGTGPGVGAEFRQGVKGPGGRRIAADYRITTFEPDRRLAFEATAGPVRPRGEYRFEPGDGGGGQTTRLTFSLDATLGFLKGLLLGRAVQASMDGEMAALDRLKDLLER